MCSHCSECCRSHNKRSSDSVQNDSDSSIAESSVNGKYLVSNNLLLILISVNIFAFYTEQTDSYY